MNSPPGDCSTSFEKTLEYIQSPDFGYRSSEIPRRSPSIMTLPQILDPLHATRRSVLASLVSLGLGGSVFQKALAHQAAEQGVVSRGMIESAQWIADAKLTETEQDEVAKAIDAALKEQRKLRDFPIDHDVPPAFAFVPHFFADPPVPDLELRAKWVQCQLPPPTVPLALSPTEEEIAFLSIGQLGHGLRQGAWTSRRLTEIYLTRLKLYDPLLHCVINLTEAIALEQADAADKELASGIDRGPLHGIPWGAKDLIAIPPTKTTWGAGPYREQVRPNEATVSIRMREAGAVLLAKLSLGTLAWGDQWHDAMTRNPWNPEQGSSGSSAGSASATVAGLCGFALGSETLGSIVSPTRRCRVTGLRPTFGRVSRAGCMTLAWSMDKIGPIARTVEDCALIFAALVGSDGRDPTVVDRPFLWNGESDVQGLTIGVPKEIRSEIEQSAVDGLKAAGADIVVLEYPSEIPESAILSALSIEASTAHEDLFRSGATDQELGNWGPSFRSAQWERAIHYLRGMRARTLLIRETESKLRQVDVALGGDDLVRTNLSGHPSLMVAAGSQTVREILMPGSLKLTARMFGEAKLLRVGSFLQHHMPPIPSVPPLEKHLAAMQQ